MKRNNIELRIYNEKPLLLEIVKWQDNIYYQKQKDYIQHETKKDFYYKSNGENIGIHKDLFNVAQTCYTILYINNNGVVEFISNRPMELSDLNECNDMLFLMRKGIKKVFNYKDK